MNAELIGTQVTELMKLILDDEEETRSIKEIRVVRDEFHTKWDVVSAIMEDDIVYKYAIFVDPESGTTIADGY